MTSRITYGQLANALAASGYLSYKAGAQHIVFKNSEGRLDIVLPRMPETRAVSPTHLRIVEKTLRDDGIVDPEEFLYSLKNGKPRNEAIRKGDRLIWTVPETGREVSVVAAAGEMDGFVVIKQKGVFSPCPVSQLRKEEPIQHQSG